MADIRTCEWCGKKYNYSAADAYHYGYCSKKCKSDHDAKEKSDCEITCAWCGKKYSSLESNSSLSIFYCGKKCELDHKVRDPNSYANNVVVYKTIIQEEIQEEKKKKKRKRIFYLFLILLFILFVIIGSIPDSKKTKKKSTETVQNKSTTSSVQSETNPTNINELRLLESISFPHFYNDGTVSNAFVAYEYDNQNRIVEYSYYNGTTIRTTTFEYKGNELVKIEGGWNNLNITKNGNDIIISIEDETDYTIYKLNVDGDIIKKEEYSDNNIRETIEYTYDIFGNLIKESSSFGTITEYKYDNKNSPFINCKSPKWLMQYLELDTKNNKINPTTKYEYDNFGYLLKSIGHLEDGEENIHTYKYK